MNGFDETDARILELLTEDARRPYSDISDEVGLSAPAVSDRIDRLRESGVIRRLTVDLDRSKLRGGVAVLVQLSLRPARLDEIRDRLRENDAIEHVFTTVESDLLFVARFDPDDLRRQLDDIVDLDSVDSYEVTLLSSVEWTPSLGGTDLSLTCAECGNRVTSEGEHARIDGRRYHFCCSSCLSRFEERYERLAEGAD